MIVTMLEEPGIGWWANETQIQVFHLASLPVRWNNFVLKHKCKTNLLNGALEKWCAGTLFSLQSLHRVVGKPTFSCTDIPVEISNFLAQDLSRYYMEDYIRIQQLMETRPRMTTASQLALEKATKSLPVWCRWILPRVLWWLRTIPA